MRRLEVVRSIVVPAVALVLALAPRTASGDVVATGTMTAECDVNPNGICCTTVTFDNTAFDVFGTSVNLGTSIGTAVSTNVQSTNYDTLTSSGHFSDDVFSSPDPSLLSFHNDGSYLCSSSNPTFPECNPPVSYISPLSNITGSVGLPGGLNYTEDGTLSYSITAAPSTPSCPLALAYIFHGPYAINAFQPAATPTGTDVSTTASTTFFDSSTGQAVTVTSDITYSNVTTAGETTVTAVSNSSGVVDSHFAADVATCSISGQACAANADCPTGETCDGYHAAFFDVSTTAIFSGPITVCGHYPDGDSNGIVDGTTVDENTLRILHKPSGSDTFQDVTISRDTTANTICGQVDSLSPFVIVVSSGCTNPSGGFAARSKVILTKINTDAQTGNDKLLIKGEFVLPNSTSFAALDPVTNGAQIDLSDVTGNAKVTATLPSGAYAGNGTAGWKTNAQGNKWTFLDKTGTPANGITKMIIKDRSNKNPNQVQVLVKGKNGNYPIVSGDEPVQASVVLGGAAALAAGECGGSAFGGSDCAFNGGANKLTCKK